MREIDVPMGALKAKRETLSNNLDSIRKGSHHVAERLAARRLAGLSAPGYVQEAAELGNTVKDIRARLETPEVKKALISRIDFARDKIDAANNLLSIRISTQRGRLPESILGRAEENFQEVLKQKPEPIKVLKPINPDTSPEEAQAETGSSTWFPNALEKAKKPTDENDVSWLVGSFKIGEVLDNMSNESADLFREFLASDNIKKILLGMADYNLKSGEEQGEMRTNLAGFIFEQLGYLYSKHKFQENGGYIVLSPDQVFDLYREIYPFRGVMLDSGLNHGIDGISFPDGLLLREEPSELIVEGLMESKVWERSTDRPKIMAQLENYRTYFPRDFVNRDGTPFSYSDFPNKPFSVSPECRFIYSLPQNSLVELPNDIEVEYIPVNTVAYRRFINVFMGLISDHQATESIRERFRNNEGAGLIDFAELVIPSERWEITDPLEEAAKAANQYLELFEGSAKRMVMAELTKHLGGLGYKEFGKKEIDLAISKGLINPQMHGGNPKLTHKEAAIISYWLVDCKGNIASAYGVDIENIVEAESKKREEEKRKKVI